MAGSQPDVHAARRLPASGDPIYVVPAGRLRLNDVKAMIDRRSLRGSRQVRARLQSEKDDAGITRLRTAPSPAGDRTILEETTAGAVQPEGRDRLCLVGDERS